MSELLKEVEIMFLAFSVSEFSDANNEIPDVPLMLGLRWYDSSLMNCFECPATIKLVLNENSVEIN